MSVNEIREFIPEKYLKIGFSKEDSYYSMKRFKKKDLFLSAKKLVEKYLILAMLENIINHLLKKNTKSVKQ